MKNKIFFPRWFSKKMCMFDFERNKFLTSKSIKNLSLVLYPYSSISLFIEKGEFYVLGGHNHFYFQLDSMVENKRIFSARLLKIYEKTIN